MKLLAIAALLTLVTPALADEYACVGQAYYARDMDYWFVVRPGNLGYGQIYCFVPNDVPMEPCVAGKWCKVFGPLAELPGDPNDPYHVLVPHPTRIEFYAGPGH